MQPSDTSLRKAGKVLRRLREERGISQLKFAVEAEISPTTLNHIETGVRPETTRKVQTINKLFEVLDSIAPVPTSMVSTVKRGLGLLPPITVPDDQAIAQAIHAWEQSTSTVMFPCYLVDSIHRIHAWNTTIRLITGLSEADTRPGNHTLFDLLFGNLQQNRWQIVNRETVVHQFVHVIKKEFAEFECEDWYEQCIIDASAKYPEFAALWWDTTIDPHDRVTFRMMGPILVDFGTPPLLQFNILGADLECDGRFRLVQYTPLDEVSASRCAAIIGELTRASLPNS
jgi:transcriptional regulator with XRE-family HTH domain